jgi:CheY-like chemotaxis protein
MPKILVIEDNPVEIETIKNRLKQKEYDVLIANNGEDGIRLAKKEKPDLIFMDMILPGMHGLEATINLKNDPDTKRIPIVALTVMDSSEFVATCFKEGISAFIRKPYDFNEIFEKTEKILGIQKRKSKKILISDKETSVVTMVTINLMRFGYHVITSPNGEAGSIGELEEQPDLALVTDTKSLNGDLAASVPLILITDKLNPDEIQKKMDTVGAEDYIAKPFSLNELIEKIERIFAQTEESRS